MTEPTVLSLRRLGAFDDDDFWAFCQDNGDLRFERLADGQILIMPDTGGKTGFLNSEINYALVGWNRRERTGITFDSSTAFRLPNGAVRSPDASWVRGDRWEALSEAEQSRFPPLCPDFVIELQSSSDTRRMLQSKMEEWRAQGCKLGWLVVPAERMTYVYTADGEVKALPFAEILTAPDLLPGFALHLAEIVR
ncbi:MAG: Uma2 family endonuclease [Catalinimonas sp.]